MSRFPFNRATSSYSSQRANFGAAAVFGPSPATITSRSKRAEAAELGTLGCTEMRRKNKILAVFGIMFVVITGGFSVFRIYQSGFWKGPDAMFGDQHLKTSVALIELHRTRRGAHPPTLGDLEFVGEWDRIALNSVSYRVNEARTKYCVQVERGWVAKPRLHMPSEFWVGTGYDPNLCR